MPQQSWKLRQASYLRKSSWEVLFGINGTAVIIYLLLQESKYPLMTEWLLAMFALSSLTFLFIRHNYTLLSRNMPVKRFIYGQFLLLSTTWALWAVISIGIFPIAKAHEQAFIAINMAGVSAGAVLIHMTSLRLTRAALLGLLIPIAIGAYITGGTFGHLLSVVTLLYLSILWKISSLLFSILKKEHFLAEHNKVLLKELEKKTSSMVSSAKLASLGEMAGGIAHEINNPLTILLTQIDLMRVWLEKDPLDKTKMHSLLNKMTSTVDRISKIIKSLKHFSRDSAKDSVKEEKLSDVISDTVVFCKERLEFHGVKVDITPISDTLTLECRATEISQVLLNLLNNAYDAMEHTENKWIQIQIQDLGENIVMRIRDSGPGIPPEIRERIMTPFFTTKEVGKGTGLGLSISHGIVKGHGGRLELDTSDPNTTFVLTLPKKQLRLQSIA